MNTMNIKLTSIHNCISDVQIDYMHNCKLILRCTNTKINKLVLKKMLSMFKDNIKKINSLNVSFIKKSFVYKCNKNVRFKPSGVLLKKQREKKFILTFNNSDSRERFLNYISIS